MNNKKHTRPNGKRPRNKMRASVGLSITSEEEITVSPYVLKCIKERFPKAVTIQLLEVSTRLKTIRKGRKQFSVPVGFVQVTGKDRVRLVLDAIKRWNYEIYRKYYLEPVMKMANANHRRLSAKFRKIKADKFDGKKRRMIEGCSATHQASMLRDLEDARPPIALLGEEFVNQLAVI